LKKFGLTSIEEVVTYFRSIDFVWTALPATFSVAEYRCPNRWSPAHDHDVRIVRVFRRAPFLRPRWTRCYGFAGDVRAPSRALYLD